MLPIFDRKQLFGDNLLLMVPLEVFKQNTLICLQKVTNSGFVHNLTQYSIMSNLLLYMQLNVFAQLYYQD